MSKIISIANQKGGVGKTTTTMNLAVELHNRGYRVLCVDLDHQANLSDYLGHEPDGLPTMTALMQAAVQNPAALPELLPAAIRRAEEGVSYIPADINLSTAEMLLAQALFRERVLHTILSNPAMRSFDYILIDCLPSLGILLTNALIASNGLIIPVQRRNSLWTVWPVRKRQKRCLRFRQQQQRCEEKMKMIPIVVPTLVLSGFYIMLLVIGLWCDRLLTCGRVIPACARRCRCCGGDDTDGLRRAGR